MLRVVEDENSVRRYVRRFLNHFRIIPNKKKLITLGHRGKTFQVRALWLEDLEIWVAPDWQGEYYRHLFGVISSPFVKDSPVVCEVNFPRSGINRKMGGAFALDADGRVYVIHRGLLGGRKGVGKGFFRSRYRGVWAEMEEGKKVSSVVVVGDLMSFRFPRQLARFVRQVAEIKEGGTDARQLLMPLDISYVPEIFGLETYGDARQNFSQACDLGLVVEDLIGEIESQGVRVKLLGPNCLSCSGLVGGRDVYLYVLPDSRSKSIREGAVHLFFLALRSRRPCRLFMVMPEEIEDFLKRRLEEFSIETVVYQWMKDRAIFPGLSLY